MVEVEVGKTGPQRVFQLPVVGDNTMRDKKSEGRSNQRNRVEL